MANAAYAVSSFLGGEISQFAQGRFDRPDYKVSLNVCLNAFPVEIGAWTRRPGTAHAGFARGGTSARVMKFDFEASAPATLEFTSGTLRFRNGTVLMTTNDSQTVSSVSAANPAVIQTAAAHGWSTGNTVLLPGASTPLLENRQFLITVVDTTHFSIADAITGTAINGASLGALAAGTTVSRIQELTTSYPGTTWQSLRSVQAETTQILLHPTVAPQALTVSSLPSGSNNAIFAINAATLSDGPYLDPFTNGALVTPSATSGVITLTVSFPVYNSSQAYAAGAFVTSSSVNYQSLVDQNVGNTPASSPSDWAAVSAGAAINNGQGFLSTDIGRLVRLFSEPAAWASGSSYSSGQVVSFNPTGQPNASTYWQSLVGSNTGNVPGTDGTHWELLNTSGAALWSWGKITSLAAQVPNAPSGVVYIGNMSNPGDAFNGVANQNSSNSATLTQTGISSNTWNTISYAGENFGGCSTTSYAISSATIFPSTDLGFCQITATGGSLNNYEAFITVTAFLYGSNSAPSSATNGTRLGSAVIGTLTMDNQEPTQFTIGHSPITILSNNTSTSFQYIWIELETTLTNPQTVIFTIINVLAQAKFTQASGTGSSATAVNVEILGPTLPYTNAIQTWRMGAFSATTGYPTCGCWSDGRIWLGGAIANRFDACVADGVSGNTINFAPTDQFGVVSAASAITEVLNSDGVNPIQWMKPDLQGVLMGTQAGEWLIQAPTAGSISPINIAAREVTRIGGSNIEPVKAEHTLIFVKRFGRKLMEAFADVFSGKFTAPNLAERAQHITRNGVAELAYTDATTPILWGRDQVGAWFGCTYKRDALTTSQGPTYAAFHRHQLGTGRTVQSICGGPSTGGALDALTMATADSSSVYHIEVLTDAPDEDATLTSAWFLDDAVNPTSVIDNGTSMTINGLWHLNGKTVQVFAGGLDLGDIGDLVLPFVLTATYSSGQYSRGSDLNIYLSLANSNIGHDPTIDAGVHWQLIGSGVDFVVSNGSITVNYGDGVSAGAGKGLFTQVFAVALPLTQIVVGCTYNSDGQLVRPVGQAETGTRAGPGFAMVGRDHFFGAQLVNSLGISFGTNFSSLMPAILLQKDESTPIAPLTLYSDLHTDRLNSDYSRFDEKLCWRINRPFPATVVAIGPSLATEDQ